MDDAGLGRCGSMGAKGGDRDRCRRVTDRPSEFQELTEVSIPVALKATPPIRDVEVGWYGQT